MSFKGIIGNDEIKKFINKQIESGHSVHSYLFTGIEGIGKTLFAKEFARKLLCFNQEKSENCESCIKLESRKSSGFLPNRGRKWNYKN